MLRRKKPETSRRQRLDEDRTQPKLSGYAYNSGPRSADSRLDRQPKKALISREKTARAAHYWSQRIGLLIFLVALLASLVNVLTLSNSAHIIVIPNGGNQSLLQPTSVYQSAADKLLAGSVLNRSKITVDAGGLSRNLMKQFPELSDVSVTIPLVAHRPIVYVEPAAPVLVLAASNGSFIVNSNGKALGVANQPSSLIAELPVLTDESSLKVSVDQDALPANYIQFIQTVLAQLSAKQYKTSSLALPATSDELDVHLTGQPYYVKFNMEGNDPSQQAGSFFATISYLKKQNITPSQYVDVRLAARAYYQ